MEKSTPAAPATVALASDQSSTKNVELPTAPVELKGDDVARTGAAKMAGFKAVDEHTGLIDEGIFVFEKKIACHKERET